MKTRQEILDRLETERNQEMYLRSLCLEDTKSTLASVLGRLEILEWCLEKTQDKVVFSHRENSSNVDQDIVDQYVGAISSYLRSTFMPNLRQLVFNLGQHFAGSPVEFSLEMRPAEGYVIFASIGLTDRTVFVSFEPRSGAVVHSEVQLSSVAPAPETSSLQEFIEQSVAESLNYREAESVLDVIVRLVENGIPIHGDVNALEANLDGIEIIQNGRRVHIAVNREEQNVHVVFPEGFFHEASRAEFRRLYFPEAFTRGATGYLQRAESELEGLRVAFLQSASWHVLPSYSPDAAFPRVRTSRGDNE